MLRNKESITIPLEINRIKHTNIYTNNLHDLGSSNIDCKALSQIFNPGFYDLNYMKPKSTSHLNNQHPII